MPQHHAAQVDELGHLQELGQLLLEAVEADDKQLWDALAIGAVGAVGAGDCTADELEALVWGSVHPACSTTAQALMVCWRLGSEEALLEWLEGGFAQIATALIKAGMHLGRDWSRAPGPILTMTGQAMHALEQQLAEELHECSDPLQLIRPWVLVAAAASPEFKV